MSRLRRNSLVTRALATCALLFALSRPSPGAEGSPLARLSWMSGCWESVRGARRIDEQWMLPRGDMLMGMSRTIVRDTTRQYEAMHIRAEGGRLVFTSKPSGQPEASFTAIALTDSSVVFENAAHDYPQRIVYTRRGSDSLLARIEGTAGGQFRAVDFPMRRAACADGSGR